MTAKKTKKTEVKAKAEVKETVIEKAAREDNFPLPPSEPFHVRGLFDDSNAFSILGKMRRHVLREEGWTEAQWQAFSTFAKRHDYDHLLRAVLAYATELDENDEGEL